MYVGFFVIVYSILLYSNSGFVVTCVMCVLVKIPEVTLRRLAAYKPSINISISQSSPVDYSYLAFIACQVELSWATRVSVAVACLSNGRRQLFESD